MLTASIANVTSPVMRNIKEDYIMAEYEKLFAEAVQRKLKSIIKGKIFVCVTRNDELLVKIYKDDEVIFSSLRPYFTKKTSGWYEFR